MGAEPGGGVGEKAPGFDATAAELAMGTDTDNAVGRKPPDLDAIDSELAALDTTGGTDANDSHDTATLGQLYTKPLLQESFAKRLTCTQKR